MNESMLNGLSALKVWVDASFGGADEIVGVNVFSKVTVGDEESSS